VKQRAKYFEEKINISLEKMRKSKWLLLFYEMECSKLSIAFDERQKILNKLINKLFELHRYAKFIIFNINVNYWKN
jgi:hypothetical protein